MFVIFSLFLKESDESGYAELVGNTDSEGYLVPKDGKTLN